MTLIDTSAWIEQLRRGGDASVRKHVEALLASGEAAWCPLVRLELWNGARGEKERTALTEMDRDVAVVGHSMRLSGTARRHSRRERASGVSRFPRPTYSLPRAHAITKCRCCTTTGTSN